MKKNIVVYTAISGNYDNLTEPRYISDNCDYVCFTDNPNIKSKVWKIISFPDDKLDEIRKCRKVKILPHRYFKDYKYSIWIDGNIEITGDMGDIVKCFFINNQNIKPLVTFKHPERNCIYQEAKFCKILRKDNVKTIDNQIKEYKKENFPKEVGLIESNVIIRDHNNSNLIPVMEDWWFEVRNKSYRDQLSFNYVAWKNHFSYGILPGNSRGANNYFDLQLHKMSLLKRIRRFVLGKYADFIMNK